MRVGLVGIAAVVIAVGISAPSRCGARVAPGWRIAPAPAWVAPAPADEPAKRAPVDASVVEYLLDDTQERVSPRNAEYFRHIKVRPRSPGQVDDVSQLELDYNPAHERLIIHHANVVRDGRAVSALEPSDVRIVQRERELEQRIYDGTLTAVIFLRDVRANDVIDYAFTVEGSDPLLGGKYVTRFSLGDDTFTVAWRQRILMPVARSLNVKSHGLELPPKVTASGDWREYLWERRDVAPLELEDGLPVWFEASPWVDVSEFGSWAEVAGLFERLFPPRERPGPALEKEIAKLRALGGTDEDRLLAATKFVQDDIRYTGLEIGLGGHKPFPPAVVLERRFGDCKDKTVLLVTLLNELGFTARPALVDTTRGRGLDGRLPSPLAFDHAIVEVTVGGASRFIDPTVSYERGPLATRLPPEHERALIVARDTQGLVAIPRPALTEPSTAVRETFVVAPDGASAELEVETTMRSEDANFMRERLASRTKKEISREYLNYYAEDDSSVSLAGDLRVVDDERSNVLVVNERYHLGSFWRDSKHELRVSALGGHLKDPHYRLRRMPFALEFPLNISHTTIVRLAAPPGDEPETVNLGDDHVRFSFASHTEGNDLVLKYELQTLADAVAPEKAERFFGVLDEIRQQTGYVLRRGQAKPSEAGVGLPGRVVGLAVVIGGILLVLFVASVRERGGDRRRNRAYKKQAEFASGEAAATAIELASEQEAGARVAELRCVCGGRYQPGPPGEHQRAAYDGRTLMVLKARCAECRHEKTVFLGVRADSA